MYECVCIYIYVYAQAYKSWVESWVLFLKKISTLIFFFKVESLTGPGFEDLVSLPHSESRDPPVYLLHFWDGKHVAPPMTF